MYVCGITPYDATHMGHANTYVAFDLLHRVWRDAGLDVNYVQNVTDVDDPLLDRARETGVDWADLAEQQIQLYREDMAALNVLPPRHFRGAVEAIPRDRRADRAVAGPGRGVRGGRPRVPRSVLRPVDATTSSVPWPSSPAADAAALFAERGGDPDRSGKQGPLDCLVWRLARDGEPAWDSRLGAGRPGWHIECSAIALELLGPDFDVQGGGSDLIFPHHEMSAGEARVATGRPFARAYLHSGMVGLDGAKMSKSRGNLVFVSKLRESGVDPMAIRLALLAHHYRDDWEWTDEVLAAAEDRLSRWREAVRLDSGAQRRRGAGPDAGRPGPGPRRAHGAGRRRRLGRRLDGDRQRRHRRARAWSPGPAKPCSASRSDHAPTLSDLSASISSAETLTTRR